MSELEKKAIPGLTEGRIVHYVLPNEQHRPAVIVRVWDTVTGMSNLQVFMDGNNDKHVTHHGLDWVGSVFYSEEPKVNTWHYIEKA